MYMKFGWSILKKKVYTHFYNYEKKEKNFKLIMCVTSSDNGSEVQVSVSVKKQGIDSNWFKKK